MLINTPNLSILITGCAGFIGMHLTKRLLKAGHKIVGIDSINNSYNQQLKLDRLANIGIQHDLTGNFSSNNPNLNFYKINIQDAEAIDELFQEYKFDIVINLAAQTGVRESAKTPESYIKNNINGFLTILEACRKHPVKHLIFASSSSVYGLNQKIPFETNDAVDHPVSLYAATKKSNELMAHSYSHLYNIPITGLRFFTVYGPWYRPDMAMYIFAKAITGNKKIPVFNNGKMKRDFTFIDDITDAINQLLVLPPVRTSLEDTDMRPYNSTAPYKIFNIGNSEPTELVKMIRILEEKLKTKAVMEMLPFQKGDVENTFADIRPLMNKINFKPKTSIEDGIRKFAEWFKTYHKVDSVVTEN